MIITNRLTIRKEKIEDANGIQEMLVDPQVRAFESGVINKTIEEIEKLICKNLDIISLNMSEVKTGKKRCVFNIERNDNKNWNMGFGTEAAQAVLHFGFSKTNLEEVFAVVNPLNIASEKIIIGIGMIYRKKIEWPDQGLVNLYSLNKDEYKDNKKRRV
jgi:hypothetical protein